MDTDRPTVTLEAIAKSITLPDPTIPVPFERFAALKNSDDWLVRATFWCYYAAWMQDGTDNPATPNRTAFTVEARNDAHLLRAITQELHVRDAVVIPRRDLHGMQEEIAEYAASLAFSLHRANGSIVAMWMCVAFILGFVVGMILW